MFSALKKLFLPFVLVTGGALFAFLPSAHAEEPLQLTNDDGTQFLNISPDINANGDVIWLRQDKSGFTNSDILFHDGLGIVSLTDSFNGPLGLGYDFSSPKLNDSGLAVWFGTENNSFAENVFLYDGQTINQITSQPTGGGQSLSFNNLEQAVWTGLAGASDNEIFLYNGNSVTQLTDGPLSSSSPALSNNGYVTWVTQNTASGGDSDIYRYFDGSVERITNDAFSDLAPKVNSNGQLAWLTASGPDAGVQFYDGTQITRLSDYNQADPNIFLDLNDAGQVVWNRSGDIFFYDGQQTIQLTNTPDREDKNPYINLSGQAVWESYPVNGVNSQIFLYDGAEVKQIDTDVSFHDRGARISDNGDVVWESALSDPQRPFDQQIFLYDANAGSPPPPVQPPEGEPRTTIKLPDEQRALPDAQVKDVNNDTVKFDPQKSTILITHGMSDNASGWVQDMKNAVRNRLGDNAENYNVVTYDWSNDASSYFNVIPIGQTTNDAILKVAARHGTLLAGELERLGLTKELHMIGHSAGGTVIDRAARVLDADGIQVGQLTYLDAPGIFDASRAEWADNYFTGLGQISIGGTFDYVIDPPASEISTNPLQGIRDTHNYSFKFYTKTIIGSADGADFYDDKGFYWSREAEGEGWNSKPSRYDKQSVVMDNLDEVETATTLESFDEQDSPWNGSSITLIVDEILGDTFDNIGDWQRSGNVIFIDGTAVLRENSPAYLFEELTIPDRANLFAFDFKFQQIGDGDYMTANFNDDLLFWFDGSDYYGDEFWRSGLIDITPYSRQTGMFTFALHSVGDRNAELWIDNLKFYDAQISLESSSVVPEPSTVFLLGLGMAGFYLVSRKKYLPPKCH